MGFPKILAIDDEPAILRIIKDSLEGKFTVIGAKDGHDAVVATLNEKPDLILIDNIMPGLSGLEVVRLIRQANATKNIPIIMVTALKESLDRIEAFRAGVDDFISKPFHPDELVVRIESKLRRPAVESSPQSRSLALGNLKADFVNRDFLIKGRKVHLTNIEMGILEILISKVNSVVLRKEMIEMLWRDPRPEDRLLDIHVATLRKKIRNFDHKIETVYGQGYVIRSKS